ncbi:MAG: segregation/condensation protein A [bacterium]|nr:segregation/condensation protein A [bacterium]
MAKFRVDLEAYNGPLDLLLFLIRQEEVDVYDIPIARITEQYLGYLKLLEAWDPNLAGDFLVMAATLMEIKSRTLLPHVTADEIEDEFVDPRMELVRQLLEYKRFKDAAHSLGAAVQTQALRFPRQPVRLDAEPDERDLEEVEIWHLIEAFNRLLEQTGRRLATHDVAYDDTPIALHAADVVDALERAGGSQRFEEIFAGRNKGELIGLFLALLELIRQRRIRAEQEEPFGPIIIHLLEPVEEEVDVAEPDDTVVIPEPSPAAAVGPEPAAPEPDPPEASEIAPTATEDTLTEAHHDPQ